MLKRKMVKKFEIIVGEKIAKIRNSQGMSQWTLAERIDVANETISRIERGVSVPSLKTIKNICDALSVPLASFFDFEQEQAPAMRRSALDTELNKTVKFLRSRKVKDIKMSRDILKQIFKRLDLDLNIKK